MSKLLENIYRSINIALINELKIATHNLNIDIYDVIRIASTKPFGYQKFLPGPGTGGHCIPIDPIYFSWYSKKKGFDVKFIKKIILFFSFFFRCKPFILNNCNIRCYVWHYKEVLIIKVF